MQTTCKSNISYNDEEVKMTPFYAHPQRRLSMLTAYTGPWTLVTTGFSCDWIMDPNECQLVALGLNIPFGSTISEASYPPGCINAFDSSEINFNIDPSSPDCGHSDWNCICRDTRELCLLLMVGWAKVSKYL